MIKSNNIIDTLHNSPSIILLKESKQSSPDYSFLIPLLAALAGGIIVLIGQGIDRYFKQKNEKKNQLRDIYANCRRIEALMKTLYLELSSYKILTQYRWYCTIITTDLEKKKHFENEHIKYAANARKTHHEIGENIANFIGQVRKFQSLKSFDNLVEIELESISNITFKDSREYNKSINKDEIINLTIEDKNKLKEEYFKFLHHFKKINDILQTLI
ncbi:hypothetical protein [Flavobacterium sp. HJSW_4]|uniref:hypothetical protein n=1 Tax=Flavobacterium sp. HJSW_4 TaxID=3344660 RepID=UPI0035F3E8BD